MKRITQTRAVGSMRASSEAKRGRCGAVLIEAALSIFLLVSIMLGIAEVGYYFFVQHNLKGAAAAGARAAIVPGATKADVETAIDRVMASSGLVFSKIVPDPAGIASGDLIKVEVNCAWSGDAGVAPVSLFLSSIESVRGEAAMQKE